MNAIDAAIFTKLTGASGLTSLLADGTAGVFAYLASPNANPAYVVFAEQSRLPVRGVGGGAILYEDMLYQVRGVTEDHSAASAGTIANQIDTALDRQSLTITGYTHMQLTRESAINYVELDSGKRFNHQGALYRIRAIPS